MLVIPAIDIYNGNIVRMINGKKEQAIVYETGKEKILRKIERFLENGLNLVHIVDLSKAIDGSDKNYEIITEISRCGLSQFIQLGGGIRTFEYSIKLYNLGFKRQVLTSLVLKNEEIVSKLIENGIEVIFSLDTDSEGNIKTNGWKISKKITFEKLLTKLEALGIEQLIHTDVEADGTLKGRDLKITKNLANQTKLKIIVAGGISSVYDLENVKSYCKEYSNVTGLIIGRAYYEGRITLREMSLYAD
ncbi:MAG: HisA/HisF-related TIM barrel protein [Fervidobacterium sp.]|nr:HisA/HisF-related TIM barrel protein [Fervidobacterium sp.]